MKAIFFLSSFRNKWLGCGALNAVDRSYTVKSMVYCSHLPKLIRYMPVGYEELARGMESNRYREIF